MLSGKRVTMVSFLCLEKILSLTKGLTEIEMNRVGRKYAVSGNKVSLFLAATSMEEADHPQHTRNHTAGISV